MKPTTKQMKTPRGTERARRRVGLHQGWRISGAGPKMQPAKTQNAYAINLRSSTHNVNWSPETTAARSAAKVSPKGAMLAPRGRKATEQMLGELGGKVLNKPKARRV